MRRPRHLPGLCILLAACSGGGGGTDLQAPAVAALPAGGVYATAPAVLLTASENSEIHCSTDGVDPAPGAANTFSGPSPLGPIYLQAGTTELRFLAKDASGNASAVQTATYVVDLTDPVVTFAAVPEAPPLLEGTTVSWRCSEACEYAVELGGDGSLGSGTRLANGSAAANAMQQHGVSGLQLAELGSSTLWVHATDRAGRQAAAATPLQLRPFASLHTGRDPRQLALLPDGSRLYVTDAGSDSVSVIDTDPSSPSFHATVATIAVGRHPHGIAVTPDGSRVYVTDAGAGVFDQDDVVAIDTASNTVAAVVPLSAVAAPSGIAITPDGSRAYLLVADGIDVLDVNPASANYHRLAGQLPRPLLQRGCVAIAQGGGRAVVDWSGAALRSVEIIDVDPLHGSWQQTLATPIPLVPGAALDLCITDDGRFAFASDSSGELCRIDLQLGVVDRSSTVAAGALALVPGRSLLLVATARQLSVVATTDLSRLGGGSAPWQSIGDRGLVVTPDGTRAYATCRDGAGNSRVAVLQLTY